MTNLGRLAFYVPSLTVGGAERVTVTVANGLAQRGYDVDIVVPYNQGSFREEVSTDVTVIDLVTPRVPVVGIGASIPRLAKYLRRREPSMVFSQMTHATDVFLFTHLISGSDTTAIPTIHNTLGMKDDFKERLVEWLAGRLSGRADQFVAVSEGVAASVVDRFGVDRDRVSVLHNPVPVSEIQQQARQPVDHRWIGSSDVRVILSVGRLERQKDFKTMLRAFRRVHDQQPDTRAIIIGRGSRREELERLADRLGVADAVSFPGYVDNPYGYMAGASVLAMSSVYEGLPTVLIEALACGCPVVSTDCPSGPREILENGHYGPLVTMGADAELASAVLATLSDPPRPETLVERARDFSPAAVLDRYESFIVEHGPPIDRSGTEVVTGRT